jgi:hypothetical protein
MFSKLRFLVSALIVLVGLSFIVFGTSVAMASSANTQNISQGYIASGPIQTGMIVKLDTKDANKVTSLDMKSITKMFGVVIPATGAALTLGRSGSGQQVYVTNYGQHDVLVTNQNGPIQTGDYITISSVNGVGMKADNAEPLVLGQAAGNFNGTTNVQGTANLTTSNGQKISVAIGMVPVDIGIISNPLKQTSQGLPNILIKVTKFATNKSVSASRVYLSLLIVLAGVVVASTMVYAGVKNGIISLGRNPLAKKAIGGSLLRLILVAIIIFAISLGVAYAILL